MRKSVFWPAMVLSLVLAGACVGEPAVPNGAERPVPKTLSACPKQPCRKGGRTILLGLPGNQGVETKTHPYPYLDGQDSLILYPGEMVTIGFNREGGTWGHPMLVRVTDPDGPVNLGTPAPAAATLSFALEQDQGKPNMMLIAANGIPAMVKYDVATYVPTDDGVQVDHVATCPLAARPGSSGASSGFETWPHLVVMVVITNIRMMPPGFPAQCS